MNKLNSLKACALLLLLMLTACANSLTSAAPPSPQPLPRPSVTMPPPPQTFTQRVEANIERWDSMLEAAAQRLTPSTSTPTK